MDIHLNNLYGVRMRVRKYYSYILLVCPTDTPDTDGLSLQRGPSYSQLLSAHATGGHRYCLLT